MGFYIPWEKTIHLNLAVVKKKIACITWKIRNFLCEYYLKNKN